MFVAVALSTISLDDWQMERSYDLQTKDFPFIDRYGFMWSDRYALLRNRWVVCMVQSVSFLTIDMRIDYYYWVYDWHFVRYHLANVFYYVFILALNYWLGEIINDLFWRLHGNRAVQMFLSASLKLVFSCIDLSVLRIKWVHWLILYCFIDAASMCLCLCAPWKWFTVNFDVNYEHIELQPLNLLFA